MDKIAKWAGKNGFHFLTSKTVMVHFSSARGVRGSPEMRLDDQTIPYKDSAKFLGVIFDKRLNFASHIDNLKRKCTKAVNLLKALASTKRGAGQETLIHLYRALIRSRIDYGSIVYGSATKAVTKSLGAMQNEVLRIASETFKSTPIESLHVLMNHRWRGGERL